MSVPKICLCLLSAAIASPLAGQTTSDLQEFNSAYLEYGTYKDSDPDLARLAARRAYELGRQLFGDASERTAMLAVNYGMLFQDEAETQAYLDEAVTIYQELFGFGSAAMIDPLVRLGRTLGDAGRLGLAAVYYQRAQQLAQSQLGEQAARSGAIQLELGAIAQRLGQLDLARQRLALARAILVQHDDAGSRSNLARAELLTGENHLRLEQYEMALAPLLRALASLAQYPNADVTLRNRLALIEAYENLGRRGEATPHCQAIGAGRRPAANGRLQPLYTVSPTVDWDGAGLAGLTGVRLEFSVDAEGFVREPALLTELPDQELALSFITAINKFRFAPRYEGGAAVATDNQHYLFRRGDHEP